MIMMYRRTGNFLVLVMIVVSFVLAFGNNTPAFACSCFPVPVQQRFEESSVVFSGRVIETETIQSDMNATFQIDKAWKGISEDAVTVETATAESMCGYVFEEGRSYLVYAFGDEHPLGTGSCGNTMPIETATEHLAVLGEGYVPAGRPSDLVTVDSNNIGPLPAIFGTGAAVAAVIAFLTLR